MNDTVKGILWISIWGLAGFFTVRAIQVRNEIKREEEAMAAWMQQRQLMKKHAGYYSSENLSSDPFEDLSKKDLA